MPHRTILPGVSVIESAIVARLDEDMKGPAHGDGRRHGQGACLFSKRLEKGRFVWPSAKEGKIALTAAQLAMLLEGIDWRVPQRSWIPLKAG